MSVVGRVESLWRYPVKSMAGEELERAWLGFAGVYGDRVAVFSSDQASPGFPWLTAREQRRMLLFRPRFRNPVAASEPPNLAEALAEAPGLSPLYPGQDALMIDVELPDGEVLTIDDPALLQRLGERLGREHRIRLLRSERAFTDCRPLSLLSTATVDALSEEMGKPVDKRRFRANVYLELDGEGFPGEDTWIGRRIRIGEKAEISILEKDPRCAMITLDPDSAERDPSILNHVLKQHAGTTGIYAAVLVEGTLETGDPVTLLD